MGLGVNEEFFFSKGLEKGLEAPSRILKPRTNDRKRRRHFQEGRKAVRQRFREGERGVSEPWNLYHFKGERV